MPPDNRRTTPRFHAPKRVSAVALAAGALCLAGPAGAIPEYTGDLKDSLGMPCIPACTLCHTRPEGGKEFLNSFSFVGKDAIKVPANLLDDDDSDEDLVPDGVELKKGTNPTVYGDWSICAPEYGCGARIAPVPPDGDSKAEQWALGALGLGVALRWQLRRRAAKRPPAG